MGSKVKPKDYTGPTEFAHLHAHTVFSALDGVASPEDYAEECVKRGWKGMAVTEHGHMASVPDMHFAFKKRGLKYVPGCEIYFNDYEPLRQELAADPSIKVTEHRKQNPELWLRIGRNRHLTVLAKNETGFHNLISLTTLAHQFGFYYKPRVWFDKLCEYKEGLIVLSGCLNGPVGHELRLDCQGLIEEGRKPTRGEHDKTAIQYVKMFKEAFGDDFYIEVQMPIIPEIWDIQAFWALAGISDKTGVQPALTNDSHYLHRVDFYLQKVMMAVDQGTYVDDPNLFHVNSDEQYFKTRAELWTTFKNNQYSRKVSDEFFERAADNTVHILDKCDRFDPDTNPKIPDWSMVEPGADANKILRTTVREAIVARGLHKIKKRWPVDGRDVTYIEQAKIELDRFIDKGFASYFLITQDLVVYGKKQGWPFGPRGSAAGSLVCYLLDIHSIDPLKWGLSFDRFMASSRGGYMLKVGMS